MGGDCIQRDWHTENLEGRGMQIVGDGRTQGLDHSRCNGRHTRGTLRRRQARGGDHNHFAHETGHFL